MARTSAHHEADLPMMEQSMENPYHRMQVTLFAAASLMLLCGCAVYACFFDWTVVSESRQYPKKPEYSIIPSSSEPPPSDNPVIDFQSIYSSCTPGGTYGDHVVSNSYNFLRFWPSGHVYLRCLDHIPNSVEADSFRSAYMGFYEVDGTNVTIELYIPNIGYIKSKTHISTNSIVCEEDERRVGRRRRRYSCVNELKKQYIENPEVYLTYIKFRVDGMTRLPDWSPTGMLWQAESFSGGIKR